MKRNFLYRNFSHRISVSSSIKNIHVFCFVFFFKKKVMTESVQFDTQEACKAMGSITASGNNGERSFSSHVNAAGFSVAAREVNM